MIRQQALSCWVVGSPETVKRGREAFIDRTDTDEIIGGANFNDARLRSIKNNYPSSRGAQQGGIRAGTPMMNLTFSE
jgi:hypothetical protein